MLSKARRTVLALLSERPRTTSEATRRGYVSGQVAAHLVTAGYAQRVPGIDRAVTITERGRWALRQPDHLRDYVGRTVRLQRNLLTKGGVPFLRGELLKCTSTHRAGLALVSVGDNRMIRAVRPSYVDVVPTGASNA